MSVLLLCFYKQGETADGRLGSVKHSKAVGVVLLYLLAFHLGTKKENYYIACSKPERLCFLMAALLSIVIVFQTPKLVW